MKCDVCDEEFDTENQLAQHKAQMHAGMAGEMPDRPEDDNLEEPDYKVASGE